MPQRYNKNRTFANNSYKNHKICTFIYKNLYIYKILCNFAGFLKKSKLKIKN